MLSSSKARMHNGCLELWDPNLKRFIRAQKAIGMGGNYEPVSKQAIAEHAPPGEEKEPSKEVQKKRAYGALLKSLSGLTVSKKATKGDSHEENKESDSLF